MRELYARGPKGHFQRVPDVPDWKKLLLVGILAYDVFVFVTLAAVWSIGQ